MIKLNKIKDFCKSNKEIMADETLTAKEKILMMCFIQFYNSNKGYAFPTYETIMKACSFGRRATVSSLIKSLIAKKIIEVVKTVGNKSLYFIKKFLYFVEPKNEDKAEKEAEIAKKPRASKTLKDKTTSNNDEYEILPFSQEHQSKISLVLKEGIELTKKQMWLLGEFKLNPLREALRLFKKKTKTNSFSFLINCYYTACAEDGIVPSIDIQRYSGNMFIQETAEDKDVREALQEIELIYG